MPETGYVHLQSRRHTAALWTANNPTLLLAEIGYETDTGKFKFGDGVTAWTGLPYVVTGGGQVPIGGYAITDGTDPATLYGYGTWTEVA